MVFVFGDDSASTPAFSFWSGKSVWLYIEGSFHATTAFLNGADIGFHEAGYTSFWLRLDNTTRMDLGRSLLLTSRPHFYKASDMKAWMRATPALPFWETD